LYSGIKGCAGKDKEQIKLKAFIPLSLQIHTFFFFVVLGFELGVYTLSHSTSPFLCWVFLR
jgi:hypothetical protein